MLHKGDSEKELKKSGNFLLKYCYIKAIKSTKVQAIFIKIKFTKDSFQKLNNFRKISQFPCWFNFDCGGFSIENPINLQDFSNLFGEPFIFVILIFAILFMLSVIC